MDLILAGANMLVASYGTKEVDLVQQLWHGISTESQGCKEDPKVKK